jgi:hypothetical protein
MDPNHIFMLQYSAILAFLYLVEVLLFGIAFNKWLILNVTVEESMDYHISNYRTNPHDIDYVQKAVSNEAQSNLDCHTQLTELVSCPLPSQKFSQNHEKRL